MSICQRQKAWSLEQRVWGRMDGVMIFLIMVAGSIGFFVSMPFAKYNRPAHDKKVDEFFVTMNTPVDFEKEVGQANDLRQLKLLGSFAVAMGSFIALLVIPAKNLLGILCPLAVGGTLIFLGSIMIFLGRRVVGKD